MTDPKKKTPRQLLAEAVFEVTDEGPLEGTWACLCPINDGSCGNLRANPDGTPFYSAGWPSKAIAKDRLDGHIAEHKGEAEGLSLEDFRAKHGLEPTVDGQRAVVITAKDFS